MTDLFPVFGAVAAALVLRFFVLSFARVKGSSMLSTLHDGDWLFVWRLGYFLHAPRRGDVVICHYPKRYWKGIRLLPLLFVKRVVALPGETVEAAEGLTCIDGTPLPEPYLDPARTRFYRSRRIRPVPRGRYFVMGDNRDNSNDSRSVGPLKRRAIVGRAVCVLWPPRRIGRIR